MAVSTERTVRDVLVAAIQGISASLGFDKSPGNVKDYPLEMHRADSRKTKYLAAQVAGKQEARAWAVDVRGSDEPYAMGNVKQRTYAIRVIGYYDQRGDSGDNYTTLIDHARLVRQAIHALGIDISGTVTRIPDASAFDYAVVSSDFGEIYVATMTMTAVRNNPDF